MNDFMFQVARDRRAEMLRNTERGRQVALARRAERGVRRPATRRPARWLATAFRLRSMGTGPMGTGR